MKRDWVWNEKFDGIRAFWDGESLLSRGGVVIDAPFKLPKGRQLDGELWAGYGDRQTAVECVFARKKDKDIWAKIRFKVFDAPDVDGTYKERMKRVYKLAKKYKDISVVKTYRFSRDLKEMLPKILRSIKKKGGEGIVVRNPDVRGYSPGRSNSIGVKIKPYSKSKAVFEKNAENGKRIYREIGTGQLFKLRGGNKQEGKEFTFYYQGRTSTGKPEYPVVVI